MPLGKTRIFMFFSLKITSIYLSELQGNPWWCSLVNEYHYLLEKQREMQRVIAENRSNSTVISH